WWSTSAVSGPGLCSEPELRAKGHFEPLRAVLEEALPDLAAGLRGMPEDAALGDEFVRRRDHVPTRSPSRLVVRDQLVAHAPWGQDLHQRGLHDRGMLD